MRRALVSCAGLVALGACCPAATREPPRYAFLANGRRSGAAELSVAVDGARISHFTFNDRGRGPDLRSTLVVDRDGLPRALRTVGVDYYKAKVEEILEPEAAQMVWRSDADRGRADAGGFYYPLHAPFDIDAVLARALLRAPGHRLPLLPAGEAWIVDDRAYAFEQGGQTVALRRLDLGGLGFEPTTVWLAGDLSYFAQISAGYTATIVDGAEALVPQLTRADEARVAERQAEQARTLGRRPPEAGLAFTHARLFDSEARVSRDDVTVVIRGDVIVAVGPSASTPVPPGAETVDAGGRTLTPGLWDMHTHSSAGDGMLYLGAGVTSVRDLGNDLDTLAAQVDRVERGAAIGPRVVRAALIDGPGPLAAPAGLVAGTPDEARAAVARAAAGGFVQVKLYSSLAPELVPIIAEAAHARGLRVSGHVPSGMNAAGVVAAGYDEIQHVSFLFLQFLAGPGDDTRTPLRFTRVAEGAAGLDLGSPPVRALLELLVAHGTVIDPTVSAFEGMFVSDPDDVAPELAAVADRLPALVARGVRGGGLPADPETRERYRASFGAMLKMVKALWDRGVTIVAGTDGAAGLALPRELELYVQAGIPSAEVLALATLGAARVMKRDRELGSIVPGKLADLVLWDGDPVADIGAVRRPDVVVARGVIYDPQALWESMGIARRKK